MAVAALYTFNIYAQDPDTATLATVELQAIRASDKTPVTKQTLTKPEIEKLNTGQDLPFLLNLTPSLIASSDAGNGVGYTYLKLRGSDASRINITLNGIPFNDAESQGTFFVDLPDFASSATSIQIQRGVGTSTNGAGAFAGSINLSTNEPVKERNIEINNTFGSYLTHKHTLIYNSGLMNNKFLVDGRLSYIGSEGYMDRAWSRLSSGLLSAAYIGSKTNIRFNYILGNEKTYQAWNGVDAATLQTDRTFNSAGTEKPDSPYKNEIDKYRQTHYQLFINRQLTQNIKANLTGFYTRGLGYYEQYKSDRNLADYGIAPVITNSDTIYYSDLVRRLWLDNHFYGSIASLQYERKGTTLMIGGGYNIYEGNHYGTVPWVLAGNTPAETHHYYNNRGDKTDGYAYIKWTQSLSGGFLSFIDLQARNVHYSISGFRDNPLVAVDEHYTFFNPKFGISYRKNGNTISMSYGRANKEPNRDDFEAGINELPQPETLNDFELNLERKTALYQIGITGFYMLYKNQLALTGKINDVGAYTRSNIKDSYRAGLELMAAAKPGKWIDISGNLSWSRNRIKNFTEFIDDYDLGTQKANIYSEADLAYSPEWIGAATINFHPLKNTELSFFSKYVSMQFLDNTSNINRVLPSYYLQDARLSYNFEADQVRSGTLYFQMNNIFNKKYVANGYTFSYIYDQQLTTENYYFPMATRNWIIGLNLKF